MDTLVFSNDDNQIRELINTET